MTTTEPRHDPLAEQSILGTLLSASRPLWELLEELAPEEFYLPKHQTIARAILACAERHKACDTVTVSAYLTEIEEIHRVGGHLYVYELDQAGTIPGTAAHHLDLVRSAAKLRELERAGLAVAQLARAGMDGADLADVLDHAQAAVDKVTNSRRTADYRHKVGNLASSVLDELECPPAGRVSTGLSDLDDLIGGGLRPKTLTVIGARPGVGKSVIASNIALNAARNGHRTLFFTLEMGADEIMKRLYANIAKVDLKRIMNYELADDDWTALARAANAVQDLPLEILDPPSATLAVIRSAARQAARDDQPLGLLVVDFLQRMDSTGGRTRSEEIGQISSALKSLARELDVPILVLSSLNRASESRPDKRPVLSDLRESGDIESDADTVWLLYRNPTGEGIDAAEVEVITAKNRAGQTGTVNLIFQGNYARVLPKAKEYR